MLGHLNKELRTTLLDLSSNVTLATAGSGPMMNKAGLDQQCGT